MGITHAGVLEEVGVEQGPQHGLHFQAGVTEAVGQGLDGLRVSRGIDLPRGYLHLVCYEEVVQMACHEAVACLLLHHDV